MALHSDAFKVYRVMLENRVRDFRKKKKLTQTELAHAAQVSRQTIYAIETKKVIPTVDIAIELAAALSTSVEKLFPGKDKAKRPK